MKLQAIFSIERGRKAKPSVVNPGEVFDATQAEADVLIPMRAARVVESSAAVDPVDPVDPDLGEDREALEAEAKELGVKFNANLSDEKLAERVAKAKADAAGDDLV